LDYETVDPEVARAQAEWRAYRLAWAAGTLPAQTMRAAEPAVIAPVGSWSVDAAPIERERILRGWTPVHLATVAHVDPRTVRSLVAGRRRPSLGTVQALCTVLGLRLADVIVFSNR
jgi:DNA-binding XRE family transcriptional regulator